MKKTWLIFLIIFVCAGCSATQVHNTLESTAYVWLKQASGIEVVNAFSSDDELLIKYRIFPHDSDQAKTFYSKASWEDIDFSKVDKTKSLVLTLNNIERVVWSVETERKTHIKTFGPDVWEMIQNEIAEKFLPSQEKAGVSVRIDEKELFFYYNKNGGLVNTDLEHKPVDISIEKTVTQEELKSMIIAYMTSYMKKNRIKADRALITTFSTESEVNPFIYLDLKNKLSIILRVKEPGKRFRGDVINKGVKSADHLIVNSHILGLITRPFSSTFRLLYWGKSAAMDVLRPKRIPILEDKKIPPLYKGESMDLDEWEEKLDKLVGKTRTRGSIKFLIGGDEFFPRYIDAILGAKKKIELRTFIFDNDDYAVKIADILKKKSKQGVDVKVLLDGMGTVMGEEAYPDDMPPGYIPPNSIITYLPKKSKVKVRVRSNPWFKADHTKTTVIDDEVCFTGGMNIGREYRYDWHDMMMEVKGPIISEINKEFNIAWEYAGALGDIGLVKGILSTDKAETDVTDDYPQIRPLYTRFNDQQIFRAQLAAIKNAKKYIYINNAYFSDNAILDEIIRARRRGVDVRVILPVNGNHEIMNKSNIVTANIMFRNGIRVFFYPGMSHIKAAVYDGWFCGGSANFDKLSFRDNLEFNLATSDKDIVDSAVKKLFDPDFAKSKEMTEEIKSSLQDYLAEFLAEQL